MCTGLDPAKPWFDLAADDARLLKTDAELVDVIHTNSGDMQWVSKPFQYVQNVEVCFLSAIVGHFILQGALSFPDNLGHVDFFPNGK